MALGHWWELLADSGFGNSLVVTAAFVMAGVMTLLAIAHVTFTTNIEFDEDYWIGAFLDRFVISLAIAFLAVLLPTASTHAATTPAAATRRIRSRHLRNSGRFTVGYFGYLRIGCCFTIGCFRRLCIGCRTRRIRFRCLCIGNRFLISRFRCLCIGNGFLIGCFGCLCIRC